MASVAMAYIVMAYIVMADILMASAVEQQPGCRCLYSYGPYSHGVYSHGLSPHAYFVAATVGGHVTAGDPAAGHNYLRPVMGAEALTIYAMTVWAITI